jgi:hypothetical protein
MKNFLSILVAVALSAISGAALAAGVAAPIQGGTSIGLSTGATNGVFDPSIADTASATRAWMCYSANNPSTLFPTINTNVQTTRLAYSDDAGATWTDDGVVNDITEATVSGQKITWTNEVCSLVYDPSAASGTQWKLFWFHYSVINGNPVFSNSWIAFKQASTPAGLASATEYKLFAGFAYNTANDTFEGATYSPVAGSPILSGSSFMSADCPAFTEPGATENSSTEVVIELNCPSSTAPRTVGLKCADPCTATSSGGWAFAGNPLNQADEAYFGTTALSGQDIYYEGTQPYLIVSPVGNQPVTGSYQGCMVFRFTNIDVGAIGRNALGFPEPVNLVGGTGDTFNGACTRAQNVTAAGWGYGQVTFTNGVPSFDIKLTGAQ